MPTLIDGMYGIPNLSTTGNVGDESSYSSLCGIGICGDMVCGRDHVVVHILNTSKVVQETISNLVDKGISWTYNANGGCGTATFTVQRSLESPGQISQGNLVEIWRYGERQWAGVIDSFSPAITMEEPERIQVNCVGILAFLDDVIATVTIKTQNWSTAITAITTAFGPSVIASWTIPTISYTINDQEFIERPLSDILQTLAVLAQDGTNKPYLWGVDEDYKGYFVALPTALDTYHMSEGIQRCEGLSVQKGPFSRIKNMIKGYGGTLQDGRQVVVQVNEAASRTLYGDKQSVVSNSNFRNEADFTRWLQGQVAILGYPRDTGSAELFPWYPEFRPYTHKLNVKNFDSGGDREYNIDSLTITDRGEGGWLRATAQIMNRYPVWAEMMERATNKFGPDMARGYDQSLFLKFQGDNYVINGLAPSIPNTTTFRVGTGTAKVAGTTLVISANKDFVLTTDLTNNATNYIWLGSDGVWDVATSLASPPSSSSHLRLFEVLVGNSIVVGYKDLRMMSPNAPTSFIVAPNSADGDFTDIQTAHDALPSTGGSIYLKPGTYTLTAAITISKSNVQIIGSGFGNTILKRGGTVASFDSMIKNSGNINDILIRGMQLDSNKTDYAGGAAYGINFAGAHGRVAIEQVRFADFQAGYTIRGGVATDWKIIGNFFYKGEYSINFDGSGAARCNIEGNSIDGTSGTGSIPGTILIQGDFHKVIANPLKGGARISVQGNYNDVSGNTVDSPGGVGIIVTPYSTAAVDRNRVSNNFVTTPPANNAGISIDTLSGFLANRTSINGNTVTGTTGTGQGILINGGSDAMMVVNHLLGNAVTYTDNGANTTVANNKTA